MHLEFSQPLLHWYDAHGRKNLPWQHPRDPYRVWVSEIMLQQTQVQTVIPYFNRFMNEFPTLLHLASADEDLVLSLWSGLGYYSRARNLHRSAKIIKEQYDGLFPFTLERLIDLPGVGPSTAAAIVSQAYNQHAAILDGNVKRVLTRFFRINGWPEQAQIKKKLWELAHTCMPKERCAEYTQAIMDLGATCCTLKKPKCTSCPLQNTCLAFKYEEQHLYPTKKIKKPVPLTQQQFLVLRNQANQIYLEKRPPTGLWGGLWCLPEIDKGLCPLSFIKERYALIGAAPQFLTSFKHRFTHFHLEIDAFAIDTQEQDHQIRESSGEWVSQERLPYLGLAKPTSRILDMVFT